MPADSAGNIPPRFFTFGTKETPADLVRAIQQAMADSGVPRPPDHPIQRFHRLSSAM